METDRTEKFAPIARVMNRTMTAALQIPHFGYKDEIDMSALVKLRKQLKHQVGHRSGFSPSWITRGDSGEWTVWRARRATRNILLETF